MKESNENALECILLIFTFCTLGFEASEDQEEQNNPP